jgi:hypothetical protein
MAFLRWFREIYMPDDQMWFIVGDFDLIRNPDNRNKPGGDINLMLAFNEALSMLGVIKIPMHDQSGLGLCISILIIVVPWDRG